MKKIINQIAIIILVVLFFSGCIKEVEIAIPYDGDKLVLHSYIKQDSNVYATLQKSYRLSGTSGNYDIDNGIITLLENNVPVTTLANTTINGAKWYVSTYKAKPNKTYTTKATAPNYTAVDGTDVMVTKPNYRIDTFYEANDKFVLRITLNDPNIENYYSLKIFGKDSMQNIQEYPLYFSIPNIAENETVFDQIDGGLTYEQLQFADTKFNGRNISLKLSFENYYNYLKKVTVVLSSISKNYYRYKLSTENQLNNSGNPFTEPSKIFSNVNNGYGIVATFADSILIKTR